MSKFVIQRKFGNYGKFSIKEIEFTSYWGAAGWGAIRFATCYTTREAAMKIIADKRLDSRLRYPYNRSVDVVMAPVESENGNAS